MGRIRKTINLDKLMTFDFETARNKDNVHVPFMLSYYSRHEKGVVIDDNDIFNFLITIFSRKYRQYTFVAHNLEFDFNVMLNLFPHILGRYEVEPRYTKSQLIAIKVYKVYQDYYKTHDINDDNFFVGFPSFTQYIEGTNTLLNQPEDYPIMDKDYNKYELYFKFLDSMNYFKMSLEKIGLALGYPKEEKVDWLGSRLPETPEEWKSMSSYCLRDSEICFRAIEMLYNSMEGEIGYTIASTALKYFNNRCSYDLMNVSPDDHINHFLKMGYAGGRTEAFGRGRFDDVRCYDVNSLYPFAMETMPTPDPNVFMFAKDFGQNELGVFKCMVYDDRDFPIAFYRGTKLYFLKSPNGYETFLNTEEIKYIERTGGRVELIQGYKSPIVKNYFKDIVIGLYDKRIEYKKEDNPLELVYKNLLNSGYGKYAEINFEYKMITSNGKTIEQLKYLRDLGFTSVGQGDYLIKTDKEGRFTDHTNYLIASTVTATARLTLQRYLEKLGKDNVFYCDTDSVFTSKKMNTGNELGEMKLEYGRKLDSFVPIRAKFYAYELDGEWSFKFKGLPYRYFEGLEKEDISLYDWFWGQLNAYKSDSEIKVEFEKLVRFKESIRRSLKPFTQIKATKEFSILPDGKRKYQEFINNSQLLERNTMSEPYDVDEIINQD